MSERPSVIDEQRRERRRIANRKYYAANKAKCLEKSRKWAETNRQKMSEATQRYYHSMTPEQRYEFNKRHADKVRQKRVAHKREWVASNPLRHRQYESKRRAKMQGNGAATVDYAAVVARANGICQICLTAMGDSPAHIDHIIPLSRGGSHDDSNLQLSHARCNLSKGTKVPLRLVG